MSFGASLLLLIEKFLVKMVQRLGLVEGVKMFSKVSAKSPIEGTSLKLTGFDRNQNQTSNLLNKIESAGFLESVFLVEILLKLYQNYFDLFGQGIAKRDLEKSFLEIETKIPDEIVLQVIRQLPVGVLEEKKIRALSREELERLISQRTKELEQAKQGLEVKVAERTLDLSAEKNKLRSVLYNISDGVVVTDRQQKIKIFNTAAQKITGHLEPEVLGIKIDEVIKLNRKNVEIKVDEFCPIRANRRDVVEFEEKGLQALNKDGKTITLNLVSAAIAEGAETDVGCILTLHDLTAEKELEVMKLDFVTMAAHELRTPMTAIQGYLELLRSDDEKKLGEDEKSFIERCLMSCSQLNTLVDNLLNVTRIEQGSLRLNLEPTHLEDLIKTAVETLMPRAQVKNITLSFEPPVDLLPLISVDKFRINEVLFNLLNNAVSYTAGGGLVKIWTETTAEEVIVHVTDNGEGLPPEALPHLFTKFFRVAGPLQAGSKGTGLGLFISKSIMDLHHGRIFVQSKLGQGSTFSFSLPRV